MLYDKRWDKTETKVGLIDFIGWLETKNPQTGYDFSACGGRCLMGQYMAARGMAWGDGHYGPTCKAVLGLDHIPVLADLPQTFGGALKRANTVLAAQS